MGVVLHGTFDVSDGTRWVCVSESRPQLTADGRWTRVMEPRDEPWRHVTRHPAIAALHRFKRRGAPHPVAVMPGDYAQESEGTGHGWVTLDELGPDADDGLNDIRFSLRRVARLNGVPPERVRLVFFEVW